MLVLTQRQASARDITKKLEFKVLHILLKELYHVYVIIVGISNETGINRILIFPGKTARSGVLYQPGRLAVGDEIGGKSSSTNIFLVWL